MKGCSSENELKINIGCGQIAAENWLNVDKSPNAWLAKRKAVRWILHVLRLLPASSYETHYRSDIQILDVHKKGLPEYDGSCSWIYISHLINSMNRDQALRLMEECYRVLRPGGRLRLVTPDLYEVAAKWREKIDAYLAGNRSFFAPWDSPEIEIGDCFVRSLNLERYTRTSLGRLQRLFDYPVQYYYDYESLALILHKSGFANVERSQFRESAMPDVDKLDVHPGSLHVEAIK